MNWGFTIVGVAACLWIAANHSALLDQYGYLDGGVQTVIAVALLITVLEMARRAIGWPLPLLAVSALLYGLLGQHIPGEFGHPGTPLMSFLGTMTIAEGGIWGSLTGVSVAIVAVFVIFGAVLNAGEAGAGFMNVSVLCRGAVAWWRCQSLCPFLSPIRIYFRFCLCECGIDRNGYAASDGNAWLSQADCCSG